jgi:4a-hydroxytetrahydrobiopterin dehydratase
MGTLSTEDVMAADLPDWRLLDRHLHGHFVTPSYAVGAEFVARIARAAEEHGHHPEVELTYSTVLVALNSHDAGGVTERDLALAREITEAASSLAVQGRPELARRLDFCIDTTDSALIGPFWAAVLDYAPAGEDTLVDPMQQLPLLWFQDMDPQRTERNRIHFDVWVPHDRAEERVAAALAAGGRLVADFAAPSFWVLADPEGNEVCVCTSLSRGPGGSGGA